VWATSPSLLHYESTNKTPNAKHLGSEMWSPSSRSSPDGTKYSEESFEPVNIKRDVPQVYLTRIFAKDQAHWLADIIKYTYFVQRNMADQNGDTGCWDGYTIQAESQAIFDRTVADVRLDLPTEIKSLASTVKFDGEEQHPFFPVPYKCAEAQAGLLGYVALLSNAISKQRYALDQEVSIDV